MHRLPEVKFMMLFKHSDLFNDLQIFWNKKQIKIVRKNLTNQ